MAYVGNVATVDNGTPAPRGTMVVKNAVPAARATIGCIVTPTVTGTLNARLPTGDCMNGWEGNFRNSESPDDGLSG